MARPIDTLELRTTVKIGRVSKKICSHLNVSRVGPHNFKVKPNIGLSLHTFFLYNLMLEN